MVLKMTNGLNCSVIALKRAFEERKKRLLDDGYGIRTIESDYIMLQYQKAINILENYKNGNENE